MDKLRKRAETLFRAGVAAADPARGVRAALPEVLTDPPGAGGRWQIVALGKAALAMTQAAREALPEAAILVVTNPENMPASAPDGIRVIAGDHPVPAEGSLAAGRAIIETLEALTPADRLLALISGGGSALAVAPVGGVTLADKAEVARALLGSGADIVQMNLVRQHLSRLKGGGWCAHTAAPVTALILSDVPGDDLRVIASGPTVGRIGSVDEAADLCRYFDIWTKLPAAVQARLSGAEAVRPTAPAQNVLIGGNALSVAAMLRAGAQEGPFALAGRVDNLAPRIAALLAEMASGEVLVFGGETTVALRGKGRGGRNQELALRVACAAEAAGISGDWVFLSGGTDGRDGPTDAAGGVVGPDSLERMRLAGLSPEAALAENDSYPALMAADALLMTGGTGTNVADLAVLIRG
ncbi:DUF4147 domain-containing protein [Thioclava sp. A2]|uniref:glycerate kinase type-2 family protein n=1 Tax=Thioclava sp. FCG-A2 TaxID=3080562 RepID=UPI0029548CC9|nr:DUF4147 domain-containing protein [Thioclava sp. A2]MDV7269488.1 DUF4147 domain-containing protein [Thioclava sp. A2]